MASWGMGGVGVGRDGTGENFSCSIMAKLSLNSEIYQIVPEIPAK